MRLQLFRHYFTETERELVSHGSMKVSAFRYATGVEALKVENNLGYFIILPFQGQQIWAAHFHGKDLGMITGIKEPVPNAPYLKTYGGFLYHCGMNSFGVPQADDTHPLHGDTPNIPFDTAYLICGSDEKGAYISVGGTLDYQIAFTTHYLFTPECRLYEEDSVLRFTLSLKNMRTEPMEYMYLAHINFRPIDGAKLIYSAKRDAANIKVHKRIGANVPKEQAEKLMAYMERVQEDPSLADRVGAPDEVYDPEICFAIHYESDENGRAYTLQYLEGVGACYVSHPTDVLPVGVRWIARTGSEDAMGMVLPATAEHLGYSNAKRAGMVKTLAGGDTLQFSLEVGFVDERESRRIIQKINAILANESNRIERN